jgi:spore cortex protein
VRDNQIRDNNNNASIRDQYNVHVTDRVAQSLNQMREVQSSTAIRVGNNVYVAVMLSNQPGMKMTDKTKKRIADRVRKLEPGVKDVFVSTNPNFVSQLNRYADDLRAGRPVTGLIERLNDLINRTFPERK